MQNALCHSLLILNGSKYWVILATLLFQHSYECEYANTQLSIKSSKLTVKNTRARCKMCLNLTVKTTEWRQWLMVAKTGREIPLKKSKIFCPYSFNHQLSQSSLLLKSELRENFPNTGFLLVRIFPYSVQLRKNTDQKYLHICTLFMQWWNILNQPLMIHDEELYYGKKIEPRRKRRPLSIFVNIQKKPPEAFYEKRSLLKKRLWLNCFPVYIMKLLRTPFLQNTSRRLLLNISQYRTLAK